MFHLYLLLDPGNCSYLSVDQLGKNLNGSYSTGTDVPSDILPQLAFSVLPFVSNIIVSLFFAGMVSVKDSFIKFCYLNLMPFVK